MANVLLQTNGLFLTNGTHSIVVDNDTFEVLHVGDAQLLWSKSKYLFRSGAILFAGSNIKFFQPGYYGHLVLPVESVPDAVTIQVYHTQEPEEGIEWVDVEGVEVTIVKGNPITAPMVLVPTPFGNDGDLFFKSSPHITCLKAILLYDDQGPYLSVDGDVTIPPGHIAYLYAGWLYHNDFASIVPLKLVQGISTKNEILEVVPLPDYQPKELSEYYVSLVLFKLM